jgi:hypothetical protein
MTKEAIEYMDYSMYATIDTDERNVKNVYKIVSDNKMYDLLDEKRFGDILAPYSRIIMMEGRRYGESKRTGGQG